jgi:hypothetical protein
MMLTFTLKHLKGMAVTAIACTISLSANAQLSYTMTPSQGTYTPLSGGNSLGDLSAGSDQTITSPIPIGFSFTFDGMTYTEVQASDNGYLHFGNELAPTGYGNASGDLIIPNDFTDATGSTPGINTTRPFVAPLWEELAIAGLGGGGSTSYLTEGISPNQTFTIEWNKVSWRAPTATDQISFQVVLHETTNVIDFIYLQGPVALGNLPTASIGIAGIANGDYYSLSDSGPNPVLSQTLSTNDIAAKPATGQMYTWMPFIPTGIKTNVTDKTLTSVHFDAALNSLKVIADLKRGGNYDFEVVDLLGRTVLKDKIHAIEKGKAVYRFALPVCAAGTYVARISGQTIWEQLKFIKE